MNFVAEKNALCCEFRIKDVLLLVALSYQREMYQASSPDTLAMGERPLYHHTICE